MKRGKKLMSLLLILLLILGATYGVSLLDPEGEEETVQEFAIFTLDPETVTEVGWDYSEPVSFRKEGESWIYTEDATFPLETSYVEAVVEALQEVTATKTIEAVEDWDQYGLEIPVCTVTITADTARTLSIGEETNVGGERYVSVGDGNVYLVDASIIDGFTYGLYDLLAYEAIPEMTEVTALDLTSDIQSYHIEKLENSGIAYTDDYIWFLGDQALDTELTESLVSSATGLTWVDCADYNAEYLSAYGLDAPAATMAISYEGGEFTLQFGDETGDYRYARIEDSRMVYKVSGSLVDTLLYTTYYELQPDEVLLMDWDTVTAVDITLDGITYEVKAQTRTVEDEEGNETEERYYQLNDQEVDLSAVTGALDAMTSTGYATGMTPEGTADIAFVIHRDHETFPEVTLAFKQNDSSSSLTVLNGVSTVFTDRQAVADLITEVRSLVAQEGS